MKTLQWRRLLRSSRQHGPADSMFRNCMSTPSTLARADPAQPAASATSRGPGVQPRIVRGHTGRFGSDGSQCGCTTREDWGWAMHVCNKRHHPAWLLSWRRSHLRRRPGHAVPKQESTGCKPDSLQTKSTGPFDLRSAGAGSLRSHQRRRSFRARSCTCFPELRRV